MEVCSYSERVEVCNYREREWRCVGIVRGGGGVVLEGERGGGE